MKKHFTVLAFLLPLLSSAQYSISTLASLIQNAANAHQASVTIPPGEYRGNTAGGSFIWIQNAANLHIIANNVKMVCEKRVRALEFMNCSNITLEGLTIDYDSLTFTQGDVVRVGSNYVDVKIHAGYPVKAYSRIETVDPATRHRKRGSRFVWSSSAQLLGGDTVRVTNTDSPNLTSFTAVGDMASLSAGAEGNGAAHTLVLSECQGGMVLKNVTINCGPGFGIFEAGGVGGTHLDGCKIVPGIKPAGATQERLLTTSWDAIQHKLTRTGPLVENCVVEAAGDDTWSVTWDNDYVINTASGNTIAVTPNNLHIGDSLRPSLYSDVVYITAKAGSTLTLNKACPWPVNTRLYSPSRRCENFTLRNNYFHSPGRVLIKAGHGLIENNIFDNMHNGVTVDTELSSGGATGISNITIRNNTIKGSGHFMPAWWSAEAGSICIVNRSGDTLSPVGMFDSILIEKNKFFDVSGVNIVAASTSNLRLLENEFYHTGITTPNETGGQVGIPQNTVVYIKNCTTVTLDSNVVHSSGLDSLLITKNVTNLSKIRRGIFDTDGQPFTNVVPYCCNNGGGNAFDKNLNSFVDANAANGTYTGIDFNRPVILDSIKFYPRSGFEWRMNGGKFQGSNDGITYTDIYTIPTAPTLAWTAVAATGTFQYLRYLSADGGFCNVAEIQFIIHDNSVDTPAVKFPIIKLLKEKWKTFLSVLRVFPNPMQKTLFITGLGEIDGNCSIELLNAAGASMLKRTVLADKKTVIYSIKLPPLTKGNYYLKISSYTETKTVSLVKL